ncbi:MAG: UDP-N-acetylmuramate dehydrogenase [Candidatus Doudnabacteria bacterium]|nr:UDP-N-acetylmuramate dehydrogenase [Candidatus Doudnabacteria bacterium]
MLKIRKNYQLKKLTTMAVGGPARYFVAIKREKELLEALKWAKTRHLPVYVVGEGSNLIPSDRGFPGLIIQNQIKRFKRQGNRVEVGAGNNLLQLILRLNKLGLAGLERMAGIPGTVGAAIYGCAGAYGQEIKDTIVSVRVWDGKKNRSLSKQECKFTYRNSIFKKHKAWIITAVVLKLRKGDRLAQISRNIIKLRERKYPPALKCPGSFFKNIKLSELSAQKRRKLIEAVGRGKIKYGKLPSAALLEAVGAKEIGEGAIKVARHHANLIFNANGGTAAEIKKLAGRLKRLVRKKFSVKLEEEVRYL